MELVHAMCLSKDKTLYVFLKLDLEKACDLISWEATKTSLNLINFYPKLVNRITACVASPIFAYLINGEHSNWFKSNHGTREGDSLSLTYS